MDGSNSRKIWITVPDGMKEELHEQYKKKIKQILEIYTDDLSEWLDQVEAKETIPEFIDRWVEDSLKPE